MYTEKKWAATRTPSLNKLPRIYASLEWWTICINLKQDWSLGVCAHGKTKQCTTTPRERKVHCHSILLKHSVIMAYPNENMRLVGVSSYYLSCKYQLHELKQPGINRSTAEHCFNTLLGVSFLIRILYWRSLLSLPHLLLWKYTWSLIVPCYFK